MGSEDNNIKLLTFNEEACNNVICTKGRCRNYWV